MTNKRITLSAGDYILLSDIPNEQVFNLVKQCFVNAGFNDCNGIYVEWVDRKSWQSISLISNEIRFSCQGFYGNKRQLSLSDIFNSINGGFDWGSKATSADTSHNLFVLNCDVSVCVKRIPATPEAIISPKTSQWWDYENGVSCGVPPVDTECEYSLNEGRSWYKCKVISQHKLVLHCPHLENDDWNGLQVIGENDEISFRPLDYKTPKQVVVENALKHSSPSETFEEYTERLYENGLLRNP